MKKRHPCPDDLDLEALLDGRLPADSATALRTHLESCQACRLEAESISRLKEDIRLAAALEPPPADAGRLAEAVFAPPKALWLRLAPAMAAALAAVAAAWLLAGPKPPPAVAPPAESWQPLQVAQLAEGVTVYFASPCRVGRLDDQVGRSVELRQGLLLVRVEGRPPGGFTVRTPAGEVKTLGTVFSVEVGEENSARVEMWRGEVELRPSAGAEPARLQTPDCAILERDAIRPAECSGKLAGLIAEAERLSPLFAGLLAAVAAQTEAQPQDSQHAAMAPRQEKKFEEELAAVRRLLAQRNFVQAEKKLGELELRRPKDGRLSLLRCDSARLQEQWETALETCRLAEKLVAENPQKELALYQQGRILLALKRPAEAEEVFSRLLKEFPRGLLCQESQYALLECYLAQEKYQQAALGARAYLQAYPQGTGADEVRKVLQMLEEKGWQ